MHILRCLIRGLVNYGGTSGGSNICDCMERCRNLPQTMTVKGVTVGGNVINCYECVENANTNLIGCKANITLPDGRSISGKVEAVSQNPYSQEEIRAEISEDWLADNVLDGTILMKFASIRISFGQLGMEILLHP